MHETSLILLDRLRHSPENEGWNRLAEFYAPLIRKWLRRYDVQNSDAEDLIQEVLLSVSKDLGSFVHPGQPGVFRGWLKAILINRLRKFWRSRDHRPQAHGDSDIDARLAQLDDPTSELSQIWNREHDQYVLRQLLALAEPHFEPNTWRAFCRVALEGSKADVVAREMVAYSPQQLDEMPKIDLDPSERAVELWISGDDASLVKQGDLVQLQFEGWPAVESLGVGLFQGRVVTVNPNTDGAGRFRILVKENDNDSWPNERYLLPGVRASGWVITAAQ